MPHLLRKLHVAVAAPALRELQAERRNLADQIIDANRRGQEWVDYAVLLEGERDHLIVVARHLTIDLETERDRSAALAAKLETAEQRCADLAREAQEYLLTFGQNELPGFDERTMPLPDPEAYLEQSIWQLPRGEAIGRATAPADTSQDDTQQVKAA